MKHNRTSLVFSALLAFQLPLPAQEHGSNTASSIQITAQKHYLNFPIRNDAPPRTVNISVSGRPKQSFRIRLADDKPDWWGAYNIEPFSGQPITVSLGKESTGSKALSRIDQTDRPKYPGSLYREPLRPYFHFSVKQGWINDANGMVYYEGEYHLFYQYNPFGLVGGENMSWGHAVSKDLVHWRELDAAIYPSLAGDIWSGSTVIDWNNSSGFGKNGSPPMISIYTEASSAFGQCIAYSLDKGRTFTKYEKNPVVQNVVHANRDPHLFWHDPIKQWVMAFFLGIPSDPGPDKQPRWTSIIQIMNSPDLKHWTPKGVVESDPECPDLFPLPLDGDAAKTKWILVAADGSYQVGSFDGAYYIPETAKISSRFNAGLYYAAQTFTEFPKGDNRRVQMVWFRVDMPGMNFTQAMSVPLELTLRTTPEGPRLCSWPVRELDTLRSAKPVTLRDQPLNVGEDPLAQVKNRPLDLDLNIDPLQSAGFELIVNGVPIRFEAQRCALSCMNITTKLSPKDGHVHLRVLSDIGTLEIFADEGRLVIPQVLSPTRPNPDQMGLRTLGGKARVISLEVNYLNSIWKEILSSDDASPIPKPTPTPAHADVSYGSAPHQILDVHLPSNPSGPVGAVIWFGGIWASDKHAPLEHFLPANCATIAVEMRSMGDAIRDKVTPPISYVLLDARRAVQFVRLHAAEWNIDPERIALGGGSQGTLPALYVACSGEAANPKSSDPVERVSTKVKAVGAWASQPSIDPKRMQEWVPGVEWGSPALGCSFAESLKRRDELLPVIEKWSPDALVNKDAPPIYFENDLGLSKPEHVELMPYKVHSPQWGLGFQKLAQERGATVYCKFPGHPTDHYKDMWDFIVRELQKPVLP